MRVKMKNRETALASEALQDAFERIAEMALEVPSGESLWTLPEAERTVRRIRAELCWAETLIGKLRSGSGF